MSDLQAIVLGIVQGATEWLPISSTGHLRILPALFGWKDPGAAFTAVIQWGTLLSALVYFRRDIAGILGLTKVAADTANPVADRRLLIPILLGTLPIVICGIAFKPYIEGPLRSLYVVGGSLIVFAILLSVAEATYRGGRGIGQVTVLDGLLVGVGQAFALIPGASRSGTTITAALFSGLERSTAARFSFLLSLPAIAAAGMKEGWDYRHEIAAANLARPMFIASVVSFVVGLATIDWLIKFLRTHPTYVFVIYRIGVGFAILSLARSGLIS
jgi:undecaprenyl-diphosphatase